MLVVPARRAALPVRPSQSPNRSNVSRIPFPGGPVCRTVVRCRTLPNRSYPWPGSIPTSGLTHREVIFCWCRACWSVVRVTSPAPWLVRTRWHPMADIVLAAPGRPSIRTLSQQTNRERPCNGQAPPLRRIPPGSPRVPSPHPPPGTGIPCLVPVLLLRTWVSSSASSPRGPDIRPGRSG